MKTHDLPLDENKAKVLLYALGRYERESEESIRRGVEPVMEKALKEHLATAKELFDTVMKMKF